MNFILTKSKNGVSKILDIFYKIYFRQKVKNKDFTIISNNCWAGRIYQDLDLPYSTPTVGLFFYAADYIKFLKELRKYLHIDLEFISISKFPEANKYRLENNNNYPIGLIKDVEIHFLHYSSENEAKSKWNKRKERINFENLFIKMCDQNQCEIEHIREFNSMNYSKKIFFSSKSIQGIDDLVFLKKYQHDSSVGDLYTDRWQFRLNFDVPKWLNSPLLER